jgi:hypothetical protein
VSTLLTARFWLDALERAIKTAAQTFVGVAGASTVGEWGTSWQQWAAGAGVAALLSVLTSIASTGQSNSVSPASLVPPT